MTQWIATACAVLFMANTAFAACTGQDLSADLSEDVLQELEALAATDPYGSGNHWVARKDGQTIHVIGTLHLNDPRMTEIAERLAPVVQSADMLLLEVDAQAMTDYMSQAGSDMSGLMLTSGPTLIDIMGDDAWAAFSETLRAHQIPPMMAAKLRPWLLDIMMSVPPCLRGKENLDYGMDRRLEDIATEAGVPVGSLETLDELLELMNSRPLEQQVQDLLTSVSLYGQSLDMLATLSEGYFDQNIAFTMALMQHQVQEDADDDSVDWDAKWNTYFDTLLTQRNNRWMEQIAANHSPTLVIAVGAAHLSGPDGVLVQLANRGFLVKRAEF